MLDLIIDGIYISDAASVISATHRDKLLELQIERVLTASAMPVNEIDKLPNVQYKFIFMMDMASQDILGDNLLEDAIAYIERAVKDGVNIVVHCEVGVSRSVTLVAAYLMKRFEWSAKKALYFIQEKRPNAGPNSSFMVQLDVFSHIGYKADPHTLATSPLYRNFCADHGIVPKIGGNRKISDDSAASTSRFDPSVPDPRNTPRAQLDEKSPEVIAAQYLFRCRRCRKELFYDTHVLYHARGSGGTTGENSDHIVNLTNRCTFEYFITPMKWMQVDDFQGKINCPKCNDKIGHFNWGGNRCSGDGNERCSTHVTPWFHIQRTRVDKFSANPNSRAQSKSEILVPTVVIS